MGGCWIPSQVDEQTAGVLSALPGCNPLQDGAANTSTSTGCRAPTAVSAPQWPYTDVTESLGFRYVGCGSDGQGGSRALAGESHPDAEQTVEGCIRWCRDRGYAFAGLENASECFCGNEVDAHHRPRTDLLGGCEVPCAGDQGQVCGGWGAISLYQRCQDGLCNNEDLSATIAR